MPLYVGNSIIFSYLDCALDQRFSVLSIYLPICIFIYLSSSISNFVYLYYQSILLIVYQYLNHYSSIYPFIPISISGHASICLSIPYISIHLSIYLSINLSIYPSIYLSIHPYIYLSFHLYINPSVYLFIQPSIH